MMHKVGQQIKCLRDRTLCILYSVQCTVTVYYTYSLYCVQCFGSGFVDSGYGSGTGSMVLMTKKREKI
jgi:hypothetical protein